MLDNLTWSPDFGLLHSGISWMDVLQFNSLPRYIFTGIDSTTGYTIYDVKLEVYNGKLGLLINAVYNAPAPI
jgi:hypothetical protein